MRILNYTIINLVMSKHLLLNINKTQEGIIHIIGIGGIGMSAIAEILHNSNYKVQGSDAQSNNNVDRLQKLGIEVYIGHNADNISQAQIVVYSSAIESDNVELIAAKNNNKIVLHRSDMLAELLRDKYVIAVSGSSGKTTTTAMIASIFDHSSIDATVTVGGILNSYKSNFKLGGSDTFLIEADESDGTMLKIPAKIAVITSINNDHIDYYGTFDNIKNAFSQFVNNAGSAVLPDSVDIDYDAGNSITFGFENGSIRASNIKQHANSIEFDVLNNWIPALRAGMTKGKCTEMSSQCVTLGSSPLKNIVLSNAIGIHKVSNALAAISVAIKLGISDAEIKKGLLEFQGVARRFSLIADIKGVKLIEDYAHHPNEIYATLTAARSITKGKVIGIIEPLRFARIRNFFDEFIRIFMMFDYVILTPVHPPEDNPIPGCGIDDIQKALISNGFNNTKIMNDALLISHFISDSTSPSDIVLFIGAGSNIAKLAKETAALIAEVKV
ncbi:UDP-N-acetylmuramate--L-alanine ligase [Wolbachia endosymbiont of Carposina sasakii]|uniref:UDP-N-acetylmuramate--L-alanine ligase n=1 Tax=Wolbachia TaxID=953 RepID=UPI0002D25179|nr:MULTISPECIES: UDP-N-acetylmuramate--L-alanine ligase [unclassified Wolbachia]AGJ99757.1 UDP-N-acetylmuramate--L-alanine ligase [Wolbachia endosymbiont of Drosophila simulans wHa]QDH19115.1 UDP-N-acetylmuramate--L-alanine ligase [Wolbachia endosymbiont of Carposina sasakii]QTP63101.1 UDP-N-acetylmuramate--L-alanine ligase [Wolbachia endosymbiont of Ceratosolen solmsi]